MNLTIDEKIIEILKQCYDPEIPIDLWNLGLIYNIEIKKISEKLKNVHIIMSLTTPGCQMGEQMANDCLKLIYLYFQLWKLHLILPGFRI